MSTSIFTLIVLVLLLVIDYEDEEENDEELCPVFDNLHRATHSLLRAARQQQRPDRVDGHALPANDLAHVLRIKPPMCLTKDDADFLVDTLDEAMV